MLIVDAANVVGSRPDGWWRDRPGAATRLVAQLGAAVTAGRLAGPDLPVIVVLEGRARTADPAPVPGVTVVRAQGSGDDAVVAATGEAAGGQPVAVVTADRTLAGRVRSAGGEIRPPGWLLDLLADIRQG
ncbi:MAG TPA: hypothetical protein VFN68_13760 [Acidimicrobiales bacterium]|nr:hypothetical protein [Acidimicrobiales bacterium]